MDDKKTLVKVNLAINNRKW